MTIIAILVAYFAVAGLGTLFYSDYSRLSDTSASIRENE
jgi:hypothetical protein